MKEKYEGDLEELRKTLSERELRISMLETCQSETDNLIKKSSDELEVAKLELKSANERLQRTGGAAEGAIDAIREKHAEDVKLLNNKKEELEASQKLAESDNAAKLKMLEEVSERASVLAVILTKFHYAHH